MQFRFECGQMMYTIQSKSDNCLLLTDCLPLMPIQPGQIIKNLIPSEPVTINKVQKLGSKVSITYTGVTTNRLNTKVLTGSEFDNLEILTEEGTFNFKGDPTKFALFAEAERINSAYQFDPLFAVNCSIV